MFNRLNFFEFKGQKSKDFGIAITNHSVFNSPKRDLNKSSVFGLSGDVITSNQRFSNVMTKYICSVVPQPNRWTHFHEQLDAIKLWLFNGDNDIYQKLSDSYNPGTFRMAYISGELGFTKNGLVYGFEITFDCEPFRYGFDDDITLQVLVNDNLVKTITNNKAITSEPIIKIFPQTSNIGMNFSLNGLNWFIASNKVSIIDSKIGTVTDTDGNFLFYHNGSAEMFIAPVDMPKFSNGKNTIRIQKSEDSNIREMIINPRWCYL